MIVKAEGQSAQPSQSATSNAPTRQETTGASSGAKNKTTSPKKGTKSFLEKYKIPIIAALSALTICIVVAIVIILIQPKGNGNNVSEGSSQSGGTTKIQLTKSEQESMDALSAVYSSDDPKATADEVAPSIIEKINNPETPTADKFTYVMNLAEVYINSQQYAAAIILLEETLEDPYIDSYQRVNLLYKLASIYKRAGVRDYEIDALQRLLDTPTDEDYSADQKAKIDEKYSKRLEEVKALKEAQNE